MNKLKWLIAKAQTSSFYLGLLNWIASRFVPFNKPHSFTIKHITDQSIHIELPYKRQNLNHINGIHACALATLCEYCVGIVLLASLDAALYRIILKNIHITYHYQAKIAVYAKFELTKEWIEANIIDLLQNSDAVFLEFKIDVYDVLNNHVCTGLVNWQIKSWKNVKTK